MAEMRAKMRITGVLITEYGEELQMTPVSGDINEDGESEDNTFARYTPSGSLKMLVNNPSLAGKFKPGEEYYLDFTMA